MFAYCGNNPVNRLDPSGCVPISVGVIVDEVIIIIKELIALFKENYEHNSKLDNTAETSTNNRIVNDQQGTTGQNFKYGRHMASWNACETIAIHNAKVLLGMDSSLSKVMLTCQMLFAMIGDGYFGTNPRAIGRVLKHDGIEYSNVDLSDMTQEGIYIISFWNPGVPFHGLHTVAVCYDGTTYTTYNYSGYGQLYYGSPLDYAEFYICGYYLGGTQ